MQTLDELRELAEQNSIKSNSIEPGNAIIQFEDGVGRITRPVYFSGQREDIEYHLWNGPQLEPEQFEKIMNNSFPFWIKVIVGDGIEGAFISNEKEIIVPEPFDLTRRSEELFTRFLITTYGISYSTISPPENSEGRVRIERNDAVQPATTQKFDYLYDRRENGDLFVLKERSLLVELHYHPTALLNPQNGS